MNNAYYLKYGLDYNPFIKNTNKVFIETSEVKELNARLDFLIQTRGMGLVTGQPGLGKTSALRNYIEKLNPNNIHGRAGFRKEKTRKRPKVFRRKGKKKRTLRVREAKLQLRLCRYVLWHGL